MLNVGVRSRGFTAIPQTNANVELAKNESENSTVVAENAKNVVNAPSVHSSMLETLPLPGLNEVHLFFRAGFFKIFVVLGIERW